MSRFVKPVTKRLSISGGDFIDVKERLTHGEREDFFATIAPFDNSGLSKVDRHLLRTTRVLTYLVGWSLTMDGTPVPYSLDLPESERASTLRGLDPDTFDEIHKMLETHIEAVDAERDARKNAPGTQTASEATSRSVVQ